MKKALVTGGCGFIGSNLVKELVKQGWQVDVVDDMSSGNLELLNGLDIRVLPNGSFFTMYMMQMSGGPKRKDQEVLVVQDDFAVDNILNAVYQGVYNVIFHQAAIPRVSYSVEQPWHTTDVNIGKTVRLFEAAKGAVERIVWASSSAVYGEETLPTKESATKKPKSPYAWQKSAIEDFARQCWELYALDIVCLRYFNVFGPGQFGDSPYATAISAWCHATKNGIHCRSDGDGSQSRDMCYIDNVVSANILAAEAKGPFCGECFNIACGSRVTNKEILDYFVKEFNSEIKHSPWRPGDVMHTLADITKAKDAFGYEPTINFWQGLEKTVSWWGLKDG